MQLFVAATDLLNQLAAVIRQIDDAEYTRPSVTLNQSTIGQHIRHSLEFYLCLEKGYSDGVVNYDHRAHDRLTETERSHALLVIDGICRFLDSGRPDQPLVLEASLDAHEDPIAVSSSFFRELSYNIEHTVHHMAILRIGLQEIAPYVRVSTNFGVAASTVRFREGVVVDS